MYRFLLGIHTALQIQSILSSCGSRVQAREALAYVEDVLSDTADCRVPQTMVTVPTAGFPPFTIQFMLNSFPAIRSEIENVKTGAADGGSEIKI